MSQIVPIGTHPGLVSALVGSDLPVASVAATGRVVRVFLRRTDHEAGDVVVASLRNATGGGGDGISVTLGDGVESNVATGAITGTAFYLRVASADSNSMNLTGWFEIEAAAGVSAALTTLTRVKEWLSKSGSADDTILTNLIAGQSARIQRFIRLYVVQQVISDELHSGSGREALILRERPVQSVSEVREDGTALDASAYEVKGDGSSGILLARSNGQADVWAEGSQNLAVDYTAGFASVPDDLVDAATIQVAYVFLQSKAGDGRLGVRGAPLDVGGSPQYTSGPWAPGVLSMLEPWREWAVV